MADWRDIMHKQESRLDVPMKPQVVSAVGLPRQTLRFTSREYPLPPQTISSGFDRTLKTPSVFHQRHIGRVLLRCPELAQIFDRDVQFDVASLSRDPEGNKAAACGGPRAYRL